MLEHAYGPEHANAMLDRLLKQISTETISFDALPED